MKLKSMVFGIAAVATLMIAFNAQANPSQYPLDVTLMIDLTFPGITISDIQIENGHFKGISPPTILPKDVIILNHSQANNDDYALSFTINNLPLGSCSLTFYTPLGTEKHPLYSGAGLGCLNLDIIPDFANPGFGISPQYSSK